MRQNRKQKFFILKSVRFGESDLILQCLSTHGDRKGFVARGALKSRKRFAGGILEPSHLVEFVFYPPQSITQVSVIQEAHLIENFSGLRSSYEKLQLGLFILDYTRRVSQEGDLQSEGLFNLLGFSLRLIAQEECPHLDLIKIQFLLKVLHYQGVLAFKSWMTPFLKLKISEYHNLINLISTESSLKTYLLHEKLIEVESMAESYVRRAELDEEIGCNFSTVFAR